MALWATLLVIACVIVECSGTACPSLPTTSFSLADVLTERINVQGQVFDHGIQFQDVNGDGLVDMLYGYFCDPCNLEDFNCVYLNTGYSWILQNATLSAAFDCSANAALLVRDTTIPFKKHTVGQFRNAVAAEFGLDVSSITVRCKSGHKRGLLTPMSELFPTGFELTIDDGSQKAEKYSCP